MAENLDGGCESKSKGRQQMPTWSKTVGVTEADSHTQNTREVFASWEHMAESCLELHVVQTKK